MFGLDDVALEDWMFLGQTPLVLLLGGPALDRGGSIEVRECGDRDGGDRAGRGDGTRLDEVDRRGQEQDRADQASGDRLAEPAAGNPDRHAPTRRADRLGGQADEEVCPPDPREGDQRVGDDVVWERMGKANAEFSR